MDQRTFFSIKKTFFNSKKLILWPYILLYIYFFLSLFFADSSSPNFTMHNFYYVPSFYTEKTVSLMFSQRKNFFELKKVLLIQKNVFNVKKSISSDQRTFFSIKKTFFNSNKFFLWPYILLLLLYIYIYICLFLFFCRFIVS